MDAMNNEFYEFVKEIGLLKAAKYVVMFVLVFAVILFSLSWYRAGMQVEVYRRQGIEMTRWEVFMGCEPRAVVRKDAPSN